MKKAITFITTICILLPGLILAQGTVFSVRVGPKMQSSQIGVNMGALQPYIGLDYLAIGLDASIKSTVSYSLTGTGPFTLGGRESMGIEGSATLLMPHVGVRYYLNTNATKPYLFAGFFKTFPSIDGKLTMSGTEYDDEGNIIYTYSESQKIDKDTKKLIEDLLGIWGLNFGFGAEYTVNENFSIGGEFGIKMAKTSVKDTSTETDTGDDYYYYAYGPNYYDEVTTRTVSETEVNAGLTFSYAAVSLNFHF